MANKDDTINIVRLVRRATIQALTERLSGTAWNAIRDGVIDLVNKRVDDWMCKHQPLVKQLVKERIAKELPKLEKRIEELIVQRIKQVSIFIED